jgi:hypothetical protein
MNLATIEKKRIYQYKKSQSLISKSNVQTPILKMHEDKLNELGKFDVKDVNIKLKKCNEKLRELKKAPNAIKTMYINDEIELLNKELLYITSGEKLNDYLLNSCQMIQKYMELEENEKSLINYSGDTTQMVFELTCEKNNIIDDYKKMLDPTCRSKPISCQENYYCDYCGLTLDIMDGCAICTGCGSTKAALHYASELSYKELQEIDYVPRFHYKKSSHLDDWIRRFQAKENKNIPQDILDKVILEANKNRVNDLTTLSEQKVKGYLKKLDLNDYYDNVIQIINRINKRPPFVLTQEVETKIKTMFQQIQDPFEKHKTSTRKNMLSYSYLLNKFFLILGLPEFSKYFFLLKSPEKLRVQDDIFKKIVDELVITDTETKWVFFPSV